MTRDYITYCLSEAGIVFIEGKDFINILKPDVPCKVLDNVLKRFDGLYMDMSEHIEIYF